MVAQGADIIDIGGESTRPGSRPVSVGEELGRVLPVLDSILGELSVPISIDTSKPAVADECIARGAHIINDVYGLRDPEMRRVAARRGAPVIIMHMKGTPETMQADPQYEDVASEVIGYLERQAALAREAGIEQIVVDPGIGFGKTLEHNLEILRRLGEFRRLDYPLMVGASRKSFLRKITGDGPDDTADATLASVAIAAYNGADLLRVHDVAPARRAVVVAAQIRGIDVL
jgi:dihydropteroate synthase